MTTNKMPESLLTVTLVIIESVLTFILRFDSKLRKLAFPLAEKNTLICVQSYVPYEEIFITFTLKGILIDAKIPSNKEKADVFINAYSFQIFKALLSSDPNTVNTLQIRGEEQQIIHVKAFLLQLGLDESIQNIKNKVFKNKTETVKTTTAKKQTDYKEKSQQLVSQLDTVELKNIKLSCQIQELKSKQRVLMIVILLLFVTTTLSLIFS